MKTIASIFVLFFLGTCITAHAQQNNNWYFGRRAGLSFNSIGTQPVPSVLSNSVMITNEAAASISDEDGQLLFYTNGVTVYNKQHQVMLNGDGLHGNISAAQVFIIPMPGNDSLFYIFTADAIENNFQLGYKYSVVNMNRDGGNGEVIIKNTALWVSSTERMGAARHANGTDVWLITNDNNSNIFRAWLIDCNGLQPSPVVSTVGNVLDQHIEINIGVIKLSPDGKMLCQTHFPNFDGLGQPPNYVQVFDFNNTTGIISNARTVGFSNSRYNHAEFSPDGKLLYITDFDNKRIDQLQITLPTVSAIQASRVSFSTTIGFYDIQLAPDGKIYASQLSNSLGVINQPNIAGTGCNFVQEQVNLEPGAPYIGLPSHINDVVANDPNNGFAYTILDSCSGRVQFNAYTSLPGTVLWDWDFGDGNTSSLQNPIHVFTPSGSIYTVKLQISSSLGCGKIYRSARLKPSGIITTQPDFDYVVRCDSGYVRFINTTPGLQDVAALMLWDFGDGNTSVATNPIHVYAAPGAYNVQLKLITGLTCLDNIRTLPVIVKDFQVTASPDRTIVVGQSVFLSTNEPGTAFQWSPSTWLSDSSVRSPVATPLDDISYTVTGYNGDGCKGQDSVRIHVLQYDDVYVPTGFTPNGDGRNDIIKPFFNGFYSLNEFSIFSRWGERMYTTTKRGAGWDGKLNSTTQPAGVYVWILKIKDKSGNVEERKGTFVLIR